MESRNVQVGSIRCSQSGISEHFHGGGWVGDLITDLQNREVHPNDLGIRVIETNPGVYYCLDHRRMWAVREGCSPNFWFKVFIDQNWDEFNRKNTGNGLWPQFIWPDDDDEDEDEDDGGYYDDDNDNDGGGYYQQDNYYGGGGHSNQCGCPQCTGYGNNNTNGGYYYQQQQPPQQQQNNYYQNNNNNYNNNNGGGYYYDGDDSEEDDYYYY